ncbi:kinase-like protein [Sistotremastrum niveocremeum HHB9708]|uniref:non-specific serine/threonine protein kinase n=1 Tax=Sistotremastrum niveocremeum HHB9708 TaxID=1314777 RepID=A0A164XPG3_9AGAM|nr:kinase-like protein [Sistotremastrum niveocremeum HHB9708]
MPGRPVPKTIVYTRTSPSTHSHTLSRSPLNMESKDEESAAEYNRGGYLPVSVGQSFSKDRYQVVRKLGWGHFSTVWLVRDSHTERHSALKVVKSAPRYTETALDEIKLLGQIAAKSPAHRGHNYIVELLNSFNHTTRSGDLHVCMVFEPLGENLLALIERHRKKGIPMDTVKLIAKQILVGLDFLHSECDLVHTDIKPENILIAIPQVESHIRTQLSISPVPSCRQVGVPYERSKAGGVRVPRHDRALDQVQIFDSQPIPSPSYTRLSNPGTSEKVSLMMSSMKIKDDKLSSSVETSGLASTSTSYGAGTISTAPTSVISVMSKASSENPTVLEAKSTDSFMTRMPVKPMTGPSLLSQTAPRLLRQQVIDLTEKSPVTSGSASDDSTACDERRSSDEHEPSSLSQSGAFLSPPHLPTLPPIDAAPPLRVKIADLGNASPSKKHFTDEIQTRQYRAPEAILWRSDWDAKVDVWSVACLVFELLTSEFLFDPQHRTGVFNKNDDHMAMIIELLGDDYPFDLEFKMGGKISHELFTSKGELRYIHDLKKWPLRRVMIEKYLYQPAEAQALCDFLLPMLAIHPRDRASASEMIVNEWLDPPSSTA